MPYIEGFALRHNAERLGLAMDSVESIVLSHGHCDHAGGLFEALKLTGPIDLYLHPQALQVKYNRNGREIGAPFSEPRLNDTDIRRVVTTPGPTQILPGVHVTGEIPRKHPIENTGGPFYLDRERAHEDRLIDDQALYIETPEGLVVLLGCGHSGVVNTLEYLQELTAKRPIRALLGGPHLLRASPERLAFTADYLERLGVPLLAPCHCTGLEATCFIRQRFPGTFHASNAGTVHHFGDGNPG